MEGTEKDHLYPQNEATTIKTYNLFSDYFSLHWMTHFFKSLQEGVQKVSQFSKELNMKRISVGIG